MIPQEKVNELVHKAIDARSRAYTPYSKFNVGAVVIDETGKEISGCNVENASYGLSMCAERTAIFFLADRVILRVPLLFLIFHFLVQLFYRDRVDRFHPFLVEDALLVRIDGIRIIKRSLGRIF